MGFPLGTWNVWWWYSYPTSQIVQTANHEMWWTYGDAILFIDTLPDTNSKFAPDNRPKPNDPIGSRIKYSKHPFLLGVSC